MKGVSTALPYRSWKRRRKGLESRNKVENMGIYAKRIQLQVKFPSRI